MQPATRARVARAAAGAGLGLLLALLVQSSPWLVAKLGPKVAPAFQDLPLGFWPLVTLALMALLALAAAWKPDARPRLYGVAVLAVLVTGLAWSNLDWLAAVLKVPVLPGGIPDAAAMVPALLALAAVIAWNQSVQWGPAEQRYLEKGVAPEEARAVRAMPLAGAAVLGLAMLLTVAIAAVWHAYATTNAPLALRFPLAEFVFPVAAVGALVVLAVAAFGGLRARRAGAGARDAPEASAEAAGKPGS